MENSPSKEPDDRGSASSGSSASADDAPAASLAQRLEARFGPGIDPGISLEPAAPPADPSTPSSEVLRRLAERPNASGRYAFEADVDTGGQGAVIKVYDKDLRRHLAMKVTLASVGTGGAALPPPIDPRTVGRFLEEAQVTSQLDHPGIVPVHELGLDQDGRVFFTMKLVKGEDLKATFARVHEGQPDWTVTRVLGLLLRACEALSYAHAKRVIHRDLKPANIMVGKFGEVYVMDWGLARVLDRPDGKDLRLRPDAFPTTTGLRSERHEQAADHSDSPLVTMDGDIVGTPAYMPPEQARGELERLSPASDVYALGAMIYHLLAGRMPYVVPGAYAGARLILAQVQTGPPRPLHELAPDAPAELVAICERAMAREPGKRYADMAALADDLRAYLDHRVVAAYETGALAELRKWVVRNKPLAAALAGVFLLLLGAGGIFAKLSSDLKVKNEALDVALDDAQDQRDLAQRNEEQARTNAATADRHAKQAQTNADMAQAEADRAERERANVLRLSAFQELEDLRRDADALWPATPDLVPVYDDWLSRARALVAGLEPRADGSDLGHRRQLEILRARALPMSDEQRQANRSRHPHFSGRAALAGKLAWMEWAQALRAGTVEAPSVELPADAETADASALNDLAWPLVDPERTDFGREAEGLALAQLAFERAGDGDRATIGDTLAWALYANGRDQDALAASAAARDAAPTERRPEFQGYLELLAAAVETASEPGWLEPAREALAALDAELDAARSWTFADEQDTWWHNQLMKLVAEIEAFADPATGLVSGVSAEWGWGIAKRRDFAASVEERTLTGEEARRRWPEALASIADREQCPSYEGLVLTPQLGLLPIGRDPDSGLWEFWHVMSGSEPQRGPDGRLLLAESMGVVLVLIPGGTFWMGAQKTDPAGPNYDSGAQGDESPVHEVTLSPYLLSKYELTQGQWQRFKDRNPSNYPPGTTLGGPPTTLLHPVEQISWDDAMLVLPRLGLTLPTEAQWERGTRAGTATPWWTGRERDSLMDPLAANLADQAAAAAGATWQDIKDWPELNDGWAVHAAVGSFRANAFGLHDVHGNVWELCLDGYEGYGSGPQVDPFRDPSGARYRSSRSGSFSLAASYARSAIRNNVTPGLRDNYLGCRPAKSITP